MIDDTFASTCPRLKLKKILKCLTSSFVSNKILICSVNTGSIIFLHSGYKNNWLWTISFTVIIFCFVNLPTGILRSISQRISLERERILIYDRNFCLVFFTSIPCDWKLATSHLLSKVKISGMPLVLLTYYLEWKTSYV